MGGLGIEGGLGGVKVEGFAGAGAVEGLAKRLVVRSRLSHFLWFARYCRSELSNDFSFSVIRPFFRLASSSVIRLRTVARRRC